MKTVVITGAASGLGKGMAEKFAAQGFAVAILDRDAEKAIQVANEISEHYAVKTKGIFVDIAEPQAVTTAFAQIESEFNHIDILINNAGIQTIAALTDFSFMDWQRMINIHINGNFLMTQAAMKNMQHSKQGGSIIFIGSIYSVCAALNKSAYVTAKHALVGLMRAVAKEGAAFNIRSNLVAPGFVKTPLVEKQIPEQAQTLGITEKEVVERIMLGQTVDFQFTTAQEVADTAYFLATFPTLALTGQLLCVSHGWGA